MKLLLTAEQLAQLQHIRRHSGEDDGPDGERAFYCKGCKHLQTRCTCAEDVGEMLPAILDTIETLAGCAMKLREPLERMRVTETSFGVGYDQVPDAICRLILFAKRLVDVAGTVATASGSDSPHSAASGARSEESNADADNRTDRDREGVQLEQQRRAAGSGDEGLRPGLRQPDGDAGCGQPGGQDVGPAVREQGAGGAVPGAAEPAGAGSVLAGAGVVASTAPRRCAKCGLAENEHDVRHVFVPAGGRR